MPPQGFKPWLEAALPGNAGATFGVPFTIGIYTRRLHQMTSMAMKQAKARKPPRKPQSFFQKELKKAVKENREILEALD